MHEIRLLPELDYIADIEIFRAGQGSANWNVSFTIAGMDRRGPWPAPPPAEIVRRIQAQFDLDEAD
jgi:hypothetical protein